MEQQEFSLNNYLKLLWRGKWLVVLTTLIALGGVVGFSFLEPPPPPSHEATTTLAAESVETPRMLSEVISFPSDDRSLTTQIQLMKSRNVIERALQIINGSSEDDPQMATFEQISELREAITIKPIAGTNLLEVVAEGPTEDIAAQRAEAIVDGYIDYLKAERSQAIENAIDELAKNLQSPEEDVDLRERAALVLPVVGRELAAIAGSLGETSDRLEEIQDDLESARPQPAPRVDLSQIQLLVDDLENISSRLESIKQSLSGGEDLAFSRNGSPFSLELVLVEKSVGSLETISDEIRDIRSDVRKVDPSDMLESIAGRSDNAVVALKESTREIALVSLSGSSISGGRADILSLDVYIDSVIDDLNNLESDFRYAARRNAWPTQGERIVFEGEILAHSLGLGEVVGDLKDLREIVDLRDIGRITAAEGHVKTAIAQIGLLRSELRGASDTSAIGRELGEVLDWVDTSTVDLQAVSDNFLSLNPSPETRGAEEIGNRASREIDGIVLTLQVAASRLQGVELGSIDLLLDARLNAVSASLVSVQRDVAGSASRLRANGPGQAIDIADSIGVIQASIQVAAERMRYAMDQVEVGSHVPSKVLDGEIGAWVYSESLDIGRSLDIASRQLRGVSRGISDPLISGELGPITEELAAAYGGVRRISDQLAELGEDHGAVGYVYASSLLQNQLDTAEEIIEGAALTASGSVGLAAGTAVDADNQNPNIDFDVISKAHEQTDAGAAVLRRVAQNMTDLTRSETDLLRYGQLAVLDKHIADALSKAVEISGQLDEFRIGRPLVNVEMRQLQDQLELAMLQPLETGVTIVDSAVSKQAEETGSFSSSVRIPLGAAAGFLLGVLGVLVRGQLDQSLRTQSQLRDQLGVTSLGVVPKRKTRKGSIITAAALQDGSSFSEALQLVGASLAGPVSSGSNTILVTSASANEGKTTLAVNLARILAQHGRKVLLVDGNLRKPDVAKAFNIEEPEGLSDALSLHNDPSSYIVDIDNLSVLPGGQATTNPVGLIASPQLLPFFEKARQEFEVVIVDGPPGVGFAETKVLAKMLSGTLLVVKAGTTSIETAKRLKEELDESGIQLMGAVLNFADAAECAHLRHQKYGPRQSSKKGSLGAREASA